MKKTIGFLALVNIGLALILIGNRATWREAATALGFEVILIAIWVGICMLTDSDSDYGSPYLD